MVVTMEKQAIFKEIESCIMLDTVPSARLNELEGKGLFQKPPFTILAEQKKTQQSPTYHPEGSVWNHTLLVVNEAAKRKENSSDERAFMWAALLHDIGKPAATKIRGEKVTAYDHDKLGEGLARVFLAEYTADMDFIDRVSRLVRYHMHIFYVTKKLPFQDVQGLIRNVNINDIALLGYCDRLGRTGADIEEEKKNAALFLEKLGEAADKPWLK
jgi:putative nucleotidyltransferase with HDIG domain